MSTVDDRPALPDDEARQPITIEWPAEQRDGDRRPSVRRLAELAVVVAALVVNLWSLSINGWGNTYYAAAARSMTQSWSNFFFAAFDPGGWITVDKPPLAFWLQAASAKVFGFSSWSILAPSAVCGALAVWLLMTTVRRVWGGAAGIIAGLALATMPVAVAVARSNNTDMALVLAVVAAAWAVERAVATGRRRWLLLAGGFIGIGFLAKLSAALIVVPALWFAYFLAGPHSWRRRALDLLAATGVIVAVGAIWVGGAALTPASARPYIGGSTDGTAWNVLTGYNGLGRVTGDTAGPPGFGGARPPAGLGGRGGFGTFGGIDEFGGTPGIGRLFNAGMGDQVMWLAPLAAAGALGATWLLIRRRLSRPRTASLIMFGGWAATSYVVFAYASGIYHNYYVSLLAPAVAALVGIGGRLVLASGRVGRIVAAAALAATAALQLMLLRRVPALTALRVLVPVVLGLAAVAMLVVTFRRTSARLAGGAVAFAAASGLVAPAAWSIASLGHAANGTFPDARPATSATNGPLGGPGAGVPSGAVGAGGPSAGGIFGGGLDASMVTWLRTQRTTERWLVAVSGSMQAASTIIAGDSVMAMGGFSGSDPAMTNAKLADLVRTGQLRYVLSGGGLGGPGGLSGGGLGGGGFGGGGGVTSTVTSVCAAVPASAWGGTGTSALYDCAGKADAIAATPAATSAPATANGPTPAPGGGGPAGGGPAGGGFQQLQQCMAGKGFTLPDPASGRPPNFDQATLAALQDCGLGGPGGGPGGGAGAPGGAAPPGN